MHPVFDGNDIQRERRVILEEIKMDEDSPDYLVHEIFTQSFWKDHALGKPILGTRDTVKRFERAVESHGGDLMMDEPPERGDSEPDDPHFLVPKRKPHETRIKYVERLAAATAAARKLEK